MAFDPISLGVSLLGGLFGRKNKAPTQTESRAPWAPAQPYLTENLATNKQLQDWYQQNPFNAQQKQGYQGLLGDVDHMRQNVAPGLMDFANSMMTSKYQRRPPAQAGGGAGYGSQMAGLLGAQQPQPNQQGPFSVAQQPAFGQINWNAQNPFYKTPEQIAEAAQLAEQDRLRQLAAQQQAPINLMSHLETGLGA